MIGKSETFRDPKRALTVVDGVLFLSESLRHADQKPRIGEYILVAVSSDPEFNGSLRMFLRFE